MRRNIPSHPRLLLHGWDPKERQMSQDRNTENQNQGQVRNPGQGGQGSQTGQPGQQQQDPNRQGGQGQQGGGQGRQDEQGRIPGQNQGR